MIRPIFKNAFFNRKFYSHTQVVANGKDNLLFFMPIERKSVCSTNKISELSILLLQMCIRSLHLSLFFLCD